MGKDYYEFLKIKRGDDMGGENPNFVVSVSDVKRKRDL
jgi:hypothetical protein